MSKILALGCLCFGSFSCSLAVPSDADGITLQSIELNESSGVAQVGDYIWSHNDSGDKPRLFVFRTSGEMLAEISIQGVAAIDWEDMCSFVRDGRQYVAVGDVGDNSVERKYVPIYVVEVPDDFIVPQDAVHKLELPATATLNVTYPDKPVNCEALAYDPLTQSFVLASKETLRCRLFRADAANLQGERQVVAELTNTFMLPMVTGGDISADGTQMALCTYGPGCRIEREMEAEGKPWKTEGAGALKMFELPIRKQGESICFSKDGQSLCLTSEHLPVPLFTLPVPKP